MYDAQSGKCAICRQPERARTHRGIIKALAVDHDHTNGKIRALLCTQCNNLLGVIEKHDLLPRIILYLSHEQRIVDINKNLCNVPAAHKCPHPKGWYTGKLDTTS